MDGLIVTETPEGKFPTMVAAFAGWPDAAEAATGAIRYLVKRLPATKFAEIDPENFYDFTAVRPETRLDAEGERVIRWQANDFFYYAGDDPSRNLILYIGTEPNLRWRTFSGLILNIAEQTGVELVVTLGALLDAVPHTRKPSVTGRASSEELNQRLDWTGVRNSGYQGPTGIHSPFLEASAAKGLPSASIWGHSPHYLNTSPNPKVTLALLAKLRSLIDFEVDLQELREGGDAFESEVAKVIAGQANVTAYVERLEKRYDADQPPPGEIPSPETMITELEEFLKGQRRGFPGAEG